MNRKAASWPAAEGTIVASALEPGSDGGGTDRIVYQYTVDDHVYESRLLSYAGLSNDSIALQRRMAAYPVGKTVPVYYDPRKPDRAVLERSESMKLPIDGRAAPRSAKKVPEA